jgi:hypothetical protein
MGEREKRWAWRIGCASPLLGAAVLGAWLAWPRYLELDVRVPDHDSGVTPLWDDVSRGTVDSDDFLSGRLYYVRHRGWLDPGRHPWKSQEEILAHFDRWLTDHGWALQEGRPSMRVSLPEADLLADPAAVSRVYHRRDREPYTSGPEVLLAVWPEPVTEPPPWYWVVLTTEQPSPLKVFSYSLD